MANLSDLEDFLKSDLGKGLAIGAGVVGAAALALPVLAHAARPLLRSALKTGVLVAEIGREAIAEAQENFEDIVAEVRSELAAARHAESVAAKAADVVSPDGLA